MPRIIVQSISGRSVEQKRELARRLNDVVVDVYKVDPQTVTVYIEEVPPENFARAGLLAVDRPSPEGAGREA
jgi:4-oxalocrotonate tautomerase family enzyme